MCALEKLSAVFVDGMLFWCRYLQISYLFILPNSDDNTSFPHKTYFYIEKTGTYPLQVAAINHYSICCHFNRNKLNTYSAVTK